MVQEQVKIFLNVFVAGMIVAFIFDLFRIKRKAVKSGVIIVAIEDFLYWIIATLILFVSVYASNDGELRGFTVLGYVCGALLYFLLLSRVVSFILIKILKFIKRVLTRVFNIIFYPVRLLFRLLSGPSKKLYNKTKGKAKEITTNLKVKVKVKISRKHGRSANEDNNVEKRPEDIKPKKITGEGRIV